MGAVDKIDVLLLVDNLFIGGAESVVASLCHFLDKELCTPKVCCIKEGGIIAEELSRAGFDVIILPQPETTKQKYTSFLHLNKIIKANNINIIHSHTTQSLIDGSLCKLMSRDLCHIHTFHFGNYPNYPKRYLLLEKLFSRMPDKLVAVGNEQKRAILQTFRLQKDRVVTIWNGVGHRKPCQTPSIIEKFRQEGKTIIGTVCTLIEQKGLPYLLEVAVTLKQRGINAVFLIAGEGHLRQELEVKAKELGINDNVVFLGWVQDASQAIIPHIDVFFLPSLWEAMSVVVLEAMAAEKPVVVTAVGENKHIVNNTIEGFVVPSRSVDDMTKALEKLIMNKKLRGEMGKKAGRRVRELCSVERMARSYEQLYIDICHKKAQIRQGQHGCDTP